MGQKRPRPDLPPTASTCTVYSELLPPELLDSLKQQANTLADCPNFWVPLVRHVFGKELQADQQQDGLADQSASQDRCRADHGKYAAERAVQLAYQQVLQRLYPGEHDIAGAEWWVQVFCCKRPTLSFYCSQRHALIMGCCTGVQAWCWASISL